MSKKNKYAEDCWNLDFTIVSFILPRLKYFYKHHAGYPPSITSEEWNKILKKMIDGFEEYINKDNGFPVLTDKQSEAFQLLGEWLPSLWI